MMYLSTYCVGDFTRWNNDEEFSMHALNELIDKHDMISGIKVFIKNILLRIVFKVADIS